MATNSRQIADAEIHDDGFLRVEHDNYYVACEGRRIQLPRTEFLLFSRLTRNYNRVVKSDELWRAAWGGTKPFNADSLHVHVYRLRRRFAFYGIEITNMVNVGYQLVLPVIGDDDGGSDEGESWGEET